MVVCFFLCGIEIDASFLRQLSAVTSPLRHYHNHKNKAFMTAVWATLGTTHTMFNREDPAFNIQDALQKAPKYRVKVPATNEEEEFVAEVRNLYVIEKCPYVKNNAARCSTKIIVPRIVNQQGAICLFL